MVEITNLVVKDDDFYFEGDLRILGSLEFTNASLIVSGKLEIDSHIGFFKILNGNLKANSINCSSSCTIYVDGNIELEKASSSIGNIVVTGEIFAKDDLHCNGITADTLLVCGYLSVGDINVIRDIYLSCADTCEVCCGGDFYATSCNFNDSPVYVRGKFESTNVKQISSLKVGY